MSGGYPVIINSRIVVSTEERFSFGYETNQDPSGKGFV